MHWKDMNARWKFSNARGIMDWDKLVYVRTKGWNLECPIVVGSRFFEGLFFGRSRELQVLALLALEIVLSNCLWVNEFQE